MRLQHHLVSIRKRGYVLFYNSNKYNIFCFSSTWCHTCEFVPIYTTQAVRKDTKGKFKDRVRFSISLFPYSHEIEQNPTTHLCVRIHTNKVQIHFFVLLLDYFAYIVFIFICRRFLYELVYNIWSITMFLNLHTEAPPHCTVFTLEKHRSIMWKLHINIMSACNVNLCPLG